MSLAAAGGAHSGTADAAGTQHLIEHLRPRHHWTPRFCYGVATPTFTTPPSFTAVISPSRDLAASCVSDLAQTPLPGQCRTAQRACVVCAVCVGIEFAAACSLTPVRGNMRSCSLVYHCTPHSTRPIQPLAHTLTATGLLQSIHLSVHDLRARSVLLLLLPNTTPTSMMSIGSLATWAGFGLLLRCAWAVSQCEQQPLRAAERRRGSIRSLPSHLAAHPLHSAQSGTRSSSRSRSLAGCRRSCRPSCSSAPHSA